MSSYHKGILIILSLGALLLGGMPSLTYAQDTTTTTAREVVESYARIEFEGGDPDEREKIIRFSPKRKAKIVEQTGMWAYVDYSDYQCIVARGYLIEEVKLIDKKRAVATIRYERLARTEGKGAEDVYILDTNANDTVTLNLVFDKNQWWVLDPPTPRISKDRLIKYYEAETNWYVERQKEVGKLPEHQQAAYDKKTAILRLLMSL